MTKKDSTYDSSEPILRQMLALSIINKLEECGFTQTQCPTQLVNPHLAEKIYFRQIDKDGRLKVKVYTTVKGGSGNHPLEVRGDGKDSIRVCATYLTKDNKEKGLIKERRIHRTGDIDEIVDRMYHRMRDVWKAAKTGKRCTSCKSPMFISKSGNHVCAEICWRTPEEKEQDRLNYSNSKRRKRKFRRYR